MTLSHGLLGNLEWDLPELVTEYDVPARLTFTDIKAHEYIDQESVLLQKVKILADLIRKSSQMIAFTGAGISTAAGIDDYATKAKGTSVISEGRPNIMNWRDAMPTKSHYILTALYELGYLKHWIQQNHDSLPQKAGYPQYALNEIHGSLHDPANPIVPYEGQLRADLYSWMLHWESKADLCLAMGTSLSGFTVDSVPINIAERYVTNNLGLGLVIINLQCTPYDHLASLRIYGKLDHVLSLLAKELIPESALRPMNTLYPHIPLEGSVIQDDMFRIPFDERGIFSESKSQILDLREGAWIKISAGPYEHDIGRCMGKTPDGHYKIHFTESIHPVFHIRRRLFTLTLGYWWVDLLTRGISYEINIRSGNQRIRSPIPVMTVPRPAQNVLMHHPEIHLEKYIKMLKFGIDEEGVKQKMKCDGVDNVDDLYNRAFVMFNEGHRSPNPLSRALDSIVNRCQVKLNRS